VGLNSSDVDLLEIYRAASKSAEVVEFINPDPEVAEQAGKLLDVAVRPYWPLESWTAEALKRPGVSR
jgi:hypothetical protein